MKTYDGIYIGQGFIKALRPIQEGEKIEIFVPHQLLMDYQIYKENLKIKELPGGMNN